MNNPSRVNTRPASSSLYGANIYKPQPSASPAIVQDAETDTKRMCIVCRKTESDVRSTGGAGLKKCSACLSDRTKYCSGEGKTTSLRTEQTSTAVDVGGYM
jgi:hypothetical protein